LVTTRTHSEELELDGITIDLVPVALHCYTIGRNLLRPKFGETDAGTHGAVYHGERSEGA